MSDDIDATNQTSRADVERTVTDPEIIEQLEVLLDEMKSGLIREIAISVVRSDLSTSGFVTVNSSILLVGCTAMLHATAVENCKKY